MWSLLKFQADQASSTDSSVTSKDAWAGDECVRFGEWLDDCVPVSPAETPSWHRRKYPSVVSLLAHLLKQHNRFPHGGVCNAWYGHAWKATFTDASVNAAFLVVWCCSVLLPDLVNAKG